MYDDDLEITKCYYCGDYATTKDHIIPVSFYYSGKRKNLHLTSEYDESNLVDSCHECNCIAWNYVFKDVIEKKDYIQERLRQKYKKIINSPYWGEDEIKEMGYALKKDIRIQQLARKWILNRIDYPNELYPNVSLNKEIKHFLEKQL